MDLLTFLTIIILGYFVAQGTIVVVNRICSYKERKLSNGGDNG